jgi:hypothetical protein
VSQHLALHKAFIAVARSADVGPQPNYATAGPPGDITRWLELQSNMTASIRAFPWCLGEGRDGQRMAAGETLVWVVAIPRQARRCRDCPARPGHRSTRESQICSSPVRRAPRRYEPWREKNRFFDNKVRWSRCRHLRRAPCFLGLPLTGFRALGCDRVSCAWRLACNAFDTLQEAFFLA